MPALRIDFLRRRPPASVLGWTLLLVGLVGLTLAAMDHVRAREELQAAVDRTERQARSVKTQRREGAPAQPPAVLAANARVGKAIALPWGQLLKELEGLAEPGVALLGFEARGAARQLRITGEAGTMAEVIAYVETLRLSPVAGSAVLGSHELIALDGVPVIRFTVDMAWGSAP